MKVKSNQLRFFFVVGFSFLNLTQGFGHDKTYPSKKLKKLLPEAKKIVTKEVGLSKNSVIWIEGFIEDTLMREDKRPVFYLGKDAKGKVNGVAVFVDQKGPGGNSYFGITANPIDGKLKRAVFFSSGESAAARSNEFIDSLKEKVPSEKWSKLQDKSKDAIQRGIQKGLLLVQAVFANQNNPKLGDQ